MKTLLLFLFSAVLVTSCQKSKVDYPASLDLQSINVPPGYTIPACITALETSFLAGQTINVGTVLVWNDDVNVYVSFQLSGNYKLRRTHLYVGACSSIPVNGGGNPRIGLYPYQTDHGTAGVSMYTYTIPRSSLPGGEVCVSSHAEVVAFTNGNQSFNETGWGQGDLINDGGSWAMKFYYPIQTCVENPEIR